MSSISYAGESISIVSPAQAREFIQRLASDLTGVRKDLMTMGSDLVRLKGQVDSGSNGAIAPVSIASAFQGMIPTSRATPAPAPTPTPAPQPSIHRSAVPTIGGQSPDANVSVVSGSVDRSMALAIDFTGNYQGGSSLCLVEFGSPYSAPPIVIPVQTGGAGGVSIRVLTVSTTGFELTADNATGVSIGVNVIVIPLSEAFD